MDFDFKEIYKLENEVVLLRPLRLTDKDLLMEFAVSEPEIWCYNANGGGGKEAFNRYFDTAIKQFEQGKEYPFIVFDKRRNSYAGSTRFYEVSNQFNRTDIGFTWYGKDYQGTGLNKNAKYLLLEFAFDKLGMSRVGFGANRMNERSINAMKSIGATVEGVLRKYSLDAEGNPIDIVKLSILKNEWDNTLKLQLKNKISS